MRFLDRTRELLPARDDLRAIVSHPRHDLLAGFTVAIVALPLALGFGISSGLGAAAGLTTAVIAGALAAFFGGSSLQVTGPTGAMTVVLVPIMHTYGATGVLTVGLMAGVILLGLAFARAGQYVAYIPASVIEGFTLGIALVIGLQQLPAALGVAPPGADQVVALAAQAIGSFAAHPNWTALAVTLAVAIAILVGGRLAPVIPFSLFAVVVATLVAELTGLDVDRIGTLPAGLPIPSLAFFDPAQIWVLTGPAIAVAALAALESLLSAAVADGMGVNSRHDPDRELFGQGLANLITPLFGGVPATGAIARTAVNVRAGASSRLAALAHAAVLALIVYTAAPLAGRIPLAALAGVLLATAIRMVEVGSVRAMARASRSEAVILTVTAIATLALDLVKAVILGLVVAGALALRAVTASSRLRQMPLHPDLPEDHTDEERALLDEHIVVYRIEGPLVFAAHRFLLELSEVARVEVVVLRLSSVTAMDASGALVLKDTIEKLEHRHMVVLVSGIRPGHHRILDALEIIAALGAKGRVFATTPEAIEAARNHLHHTGLVPRG
ncbi:SulP family inorganic anion transporter [Kribbella sp. NBC_01245]|uniref:SulP family inorganic anion transporter n=1 Tax=Kribbella sp. NBC_01245 TaxID=2903578 RepID=UPI002E2DCC2C|nr:SulP family inorganic anion transporter [Kribbella sp. NBC_01245]